MKFMVECPVLSDADGGAWLSPDNIAEFARTAEEAGVDAVSFTDHPAPSKKWLDTAAATRPSTRSSRSASAPR